MHNTSVTPCIKDLSQYRELAAKSIKNGKIFRIIRCTRLGRVCSELKRRGFVEVTVIPKQSILNQMTLMQLCQEAEDGNDYERALMSKLVGDTVPNFVWLSKQTQYNFFHATEHVNRIEFRQLNFTIKHHMIKIAQKIEKKFGTFSHPRAYEIIHSEDIDKFEIEFHWTVITSFILLLNSNFQVSDDHSALSMEVVDIALSAISTRFLNGFEIVQDVYEKILKDPDTKFYGRQLTRILYKNKIRDISEVILSKWPSRKIDGFHNVWIAKPSFSDRGEGILVSNRKQEIIDYINVNDEEPYVVQKYIENPLLIFQAKFDIRQYFVVTIDKTSVKGWAHGKCHIKLASHAFTLDNFEESIHVTNITIQKKYRETTSEYLPTNHVLSVEDLDKFLVQQSENRKPGVFERRIFPAMKKTLKEMCEISLQSDNIDVRKGRFELFGCDWMVTDDMDVQLLEINRGPSLENLTPVSTTALQEVLQDLVKISVDRYYDPAADTGGFEKIYEKNVEQFMLKEQPDSGYSSRKSSVESNCSWSIPSKSNFFQL